MSGRKLLWAQRRVFGVGLVIVAIWALYYMAAPSSISTSLHAVQHTGTKQAPTRSNYLSNIKTFMLGTRRPGSEDTDEPGGPEVTSKVFQRDDVRVVSSQRWGGLNVPFPDILTESEALKFPPCNSLNSVADASKSKVIIVDKKSTYNIGDRIRLKVSMFDHQGKPKSTGGDVLKVLIGNPTIQAFSPGVVHDHGDGTYTAEVDVLWGGAATIVASVVYTRESITAYYSMRRKMISTRHMDAVFVSRTFREKTHCHTDVNHLINMTRNSEVCNFTYMNSGSPWYCNKPADIHLLCEDWKSISVNHNPPIPLTPTELELIKSRRWNISAPIEIEIAASADNQMALPKLPCNALDKTHLWTTRKPTGYFYKGDWILRDCLGGREAVFQKCLHEKSVYLMGDSTLRSWFQKAFMPRFHCLPVTEKWTQEKWHKPAECKNKDVKLRIGWYPHAQPFSVGDDEKSYTIYSMARRIDDIPDNEHAFIVIHLFMHIVPFQENTFRTKMTLIRKSVDRLFKRNKFAKVFLKAPHSYTNSPSGDSRLNDFFGMVYINIMYEIYKGLYDRVIFLNNMDSTDALQVQWNHPDDNIVNAMVSQMLSFGC